MERSVWALLPSASRGFASVAHIPALRVLSEFDITAVCTARLDSADAAARHDRVALAFSDPEQLARHPAVEKVPDHYRPRVAAIAAGKYVYCDWPLGRDTAEALQMLSAAQQSGVRHAVGLQGQMPPAINYVKDMVANGYVGRVLTATMIGCAPNWGAAIDRAYRADRTNGANLLTITVSNRPTQNAPRISEVIRHSRERGRNPFRVLATCALCSSFPRKRAKAGT